MKRAASIIKAALFCIQMTGGKGKAKSAFDLVRELDCVREGKRTPPIALSFSKNADDVFIPLVLQFLFLALIVDFVSPPPCVLKNGGHAPTDSRTNPLPIGIQSEFLRIFHVA